MIHFDFFLNRFESKLVPVHRCLFRSAILLFKPYYRSRRCPGIDLIWWVPQPERQLAAAALEAVVARVPLSMGSPAQDGVRPEPFPPAGNPASGAAGGPGDLTGRARNTQTPRGCSEGGAAARPRWQAGPMATGTSKEVMSGCRCVHVSAARV